METNNEIMTKECYQYEKKIDTLETIVDKLEAENKKLNNEHDQTLKEALQEIQELHGENEDLEEKKEALEEEKQELEEEKKELEEKEIDKGEELVELKNELKASRMKTAQLESKNWGYVQQISKLEQANEEIFEDSSETGNDDFSSQISNEVETDTIFKPKFSLETVHQELRNQNIESTKTRDGSKLLYEHLHKAIKNGNWFFPSRLNFRDFENFGFDPNRVGCRAFSCGEYKLKKVPYLLAYSVVQILK